MAPRPSTYCSSRRVYSAKAADAVSEPSTASKFGTSSMSHMPIVEAAAREALILSERTRFTPFVLYSAPSHSPTVIMLRAQPGPNTAPLRRRRQSTRLNCAASPSYSGPDNVRSGTLSLFRHGIVLSLWGVALRAHPPSLMLTPLLVWVHPLCGHCHAGARQRSSVMLRCGM